MLRVQRRVLQREQRPVQGVPRPQRARGTQPVNRLCRALGLRRMLGGRRVPRRLELRRLELRRLERHRRGHRRPDRVGLDRSP